MTLTYHIFTEADWPDVWATLRPTFQDGESYPCDLDISEADARAYWLAPTHTVIVARDANGTFVGSYYVRADQGGPGDHICNCGYVIAPAQRGAGHALALCLHSQSLARNRGFRGMKFNLVVATNDAAVKSWKRAGLEIVGVVPEAFRSRKHGFVDAYIMYKDLTRTS
ncbi:MAG: GNAT family protein [Pseudomonadota bacterium]